jgi:hypothetical protein
MFAESDYNSEEHARLIDQMLGKKPPENEINLIEGVDDDAVTLDALPPDDEEKK